MENSIKIKTRLLNNKQITILSDDTIGNELTPSGKNKNYFEGIVKKLNYFSIYQQIIPKISKYLPYPKKSQDK